MIKLILVAALAAVMLTPAAASSQTRGYAGANVFAAGQGAPSKCDAITDPVEKQKCLSSEQKKDGGLTK